MADNILIESLCRARRAEEAAALLRRMKEEARLAPDAVTFATLIHGLCAAGDLRGALGLFREMERDGLRPTVATYNVLIRGFAAKLEAPADVPQPQHHRNSRDLGGQVATCAAVPIGALTAPIGPTGEWRGPDLTQS